LEFGPEPKAGGWKSRCTQAQRHPGPQAVCPEDHPHPAESVDEHNHLGGGPEIGQKEGSAPVALGANGCQNRKSNVQVSIPSSNQSHRCDAYTSIYYRLVTAAEMLSDDADQSKSSSDKAKEKKSEKSLTIGARITEHDLSSRLKNIVKWLAKRHEVRILIQGNSSGSDESSSERIVKAIEQTIKEPQLIGRIVQKRSKSSFIKFSIIPVAAPPVAADKPNAVQS